MKKILYHIGVLCIIMMSMCVIEKTVVKAATPFQKWGQLKVSGTNIANEKGKKVHLKGVSTHGIAWYPQYVNQSCFKSFRKMGANTIRLALYSDPKDGYSPSLHSKVEEGIRYATKLGMYVIIDWHILNDGNPKIHEKQALKFFTYFAKKYGKQKNIIYEICNEPNGNVTWSKHIKPYAKKVIKRIRKYDKKNIVIVGTPTWSQDVDVVAQSPLKGKNIVYALHFYAATHTDWNREKVKTAYKLGLPMLVSEFNICDASGTGRIDKKSGKKWLNLLNKNKIGYIAWNVSNKNETSALIKSACMKTTNIKRKDLTKTGKWIVDSWKK